MCSIDHHSTIKICPTGSDVRTKLLALRSVVGTKANFCMPQAGGSASLITEDTGCMSETLTQWLGFGGNIGTWLGTLVIAPIAERFFERCVRCTLPAVNRKIAGAEKINFCVAGVSSFASSSCSRSSWLSLASTQQASQSENIQHYCRLQEPRYLYVRSCMLVQILRVL